MKQEGYTYNIMKKTFADNLYNWRKEANMTQEQLAFEIGVNAKTIIAWEHGKNMPEWDAYFQLCKLMDSPPGGPFSIITDKEKLEESESFHFEPTIIEKYDYTDRYDLLYWHSSKLIYTDDPDARSFINKVGIYELLGSVTKDKKRIVMFTVPNQMYTYFCTQQICFQYEIRKKTKKQVNLETSTYQYTFEMNQDIDRLDMYLFLMNTHSSKVIRWEVYIAEKTGHAFRLPYKALHLNV